MIRQIAEKGIAVQSDFLSPSEVKIINSDFENHLQEFKPAGIGRLDRNQVQNNIRGDKTFWLDVHQPSEAQKIFVEKMNSLKETINKNLFLGLWDFEGHYAIYPKGSSYKKHLDAFRDNNLRVLSFILYLNQKWTKEDGGELKIYTPEKEIFVEPKGGSLVCFLSHKFEHEVLETRQERRSFTGWFRKRQS